MAKTGLEERLQEILNTHADNVERYKSERDSLRNKARFCSEHKFEEEKRITMVRLEQVEMLFYDYQQMNEAIKDALHDWNS